MSLQTWLFAMLKGGTRKSTSCIFSAFALADEGEEVLVIDADAGTQGVTDWASRVYAADAELPFHVAQWSPKLGLLVPFIKAQIKAHPTVTRVLIDVGGEAPEVVRQAVILADLVIVPCGAEQAELSRLEATKTVLTGAGYPPMAVLLTRVPHTGKGAAAAVRTVLDDNGYHVLPTEIPQHRGMYADPWGKVPASTGAYAELVAHILRMEGKNRASA